MELDIIRNRLNKYLIESEDLYWRNWVGLEDDIDIAGLYLKYREIFSKACLDYVRGALANERDPEHKHRLRALYGQLVLGYLEFETRELQQTILKKEAATSVMFDGTTIPVRSFGVKILNEPNRERRRAMVQARETVVHREINPHRVEWVQLLFNAIRGLGFANYIDMCNEIQNRDLRRFAAEMQRFLDESESIYLKWLSVYLQREAGTAANEACDEADLSAIFRCKRFDPHFPQDNLIPTVTKTIQSMGFSLNGIHLDLEDRPKKKPRACVSAVNPPDDVRLTVFPAGGYDDYAGFLHESGHAVHFVHERPDLDFEFKFWGDRGFTEGTAYLFQHITVNPVWLREMIGMTQQDEFLRFNAFLNLLRFRRLIGQFLYQIELFEAQSVNNMREQFKLNMQRAHGVSFESSGYLSFDMEFYSAGYIRARMFENQLRLYLTDTFGDAWWRNPKTAEFLRAYYRNGRKLRADDVVLDLGFNGLDNALYLSEQAVWLNSD